MRNYHTVSHRAIVFHIPIEISAFEPMKNGLSGPLKDGSKGKYILYIYSYIYISIYIYSGGSVIKNPPAMHELQETWV